jgi:hypothetical protein
MRPLYHVQKNRDPKKEGHPLWMAFPVIGDQISVVHVHSSFHNHIAVHDQGNEVGTSL